MRASEPEKSALRETLIGALGLSICFLCLCAYASHQRDGLNQAARLMDNPRLAASAPENIPAASADSLRPGSASVRAYPP